MRRGYVAGARGWLLILTVLAFHAQVSGSLLRLDTMGSPRILKSNGCDTGSCAAPDSDFEKETYEKVISGIINIATESVSQLEIFTSVVTAIDDVLGGEGTDEMQELVEYVTYLIDYEITVSEVKDQIMDLGNLINDAKVKLNKYLQYDVDSDETSPNLLDARDACDSYHNVLIKPANDASEATRSRLAVSNEYCTVCMAARSIFHSVDPSSQNTDSLDEIINDCAYVAPGLVDTAITERLSMIDQTYTRSVNSGTVCSPISFTGKYSYKANDGKTKILNWLNRGGCDTGDCSLVGCFTGRYDECDGIKDKAQDCIDDYILKKRQALENFYQYNVQKPALTWAAIKNPDQARGWIEISGLNHDILSICEITLVGPDGGIIPLVNAVAGTTAPGSQTGFAVDGSDDTCYHSKNEVNGMYISTYGTPTFKAYFATDLLPVEVNIVTTTSANQNALKGATVTINGLEVKTISNRNLPQRIALDYSIIDTETQNAFAIDTLQSGIIKVPDHEFIYRGNGGYAMWFPSLAKYFNRGTNSFDAIISSTYSFALDGTIRVVLTTDKTISSPSTHTYEITLSGSEGTTCANKWGDTTVVSPERGAVYTRFFVCDTTGFYGWGATETVEKVSIKASNGNSDGWGVYVDVQQANAGTVSRFKLSDGSTRGWVRGTPYVFSRA